MQESTLVGGLGMYGFTLVGGLFSELFYTRAQLLKASLA